MIIDYDKWHDGIGYDLDLLAQASPDELRSIEDMLINRSNSDWRDVEALAALNTNRAKEALKQAFNAGSSAVQMAVHSYAPEVMTKQQRTASLVKVLLEGDRFWRSLTSADACWVVSSAASHSCPIAGTDGTGWRHRMPLRCDALLPAREIHVHVRLGPSAVLPAFQYG
jgi:hypothetical protein